MRFDNDTLSLDMVSIHASAKEATRLRIIIFVFMICFDPRLREGGDDLHLVADIAVRLFRSTPPRRRRLR